MDNKGPIILVEGLIKNYYQGSIENKVLRGVDLHVNPGEFVVIFGPSGSGKSTLLNVLSGLEVPTEGKVIIDGQNLGQLNPIERARFHREKVGMVFQAYNLIPSLTIMQNITLPLVFARMSKKEREEKAVVLLKKFQLDHLSHRLPVEASGGQMQRVGIIRALVSGPPIIIADEPTGNLDSVATHNVMDFFAELNRSFGNTLVVVTHDPSLAKYADRIIHVLDGKVQKETAGHRGHHEKVHKDSILEQMMHEERDHVRLRMLDILIFMLSRHQLAIFSKGEIDLIVNLMIKRKNAEITLPQFFEELDRPMKDGGVGLYRPTAHHIAEHFEQVLHITR